MRLSARKKVLIYLRTSDSDESLSHMGLLMIPGMIVTLLSPEPSQDTPKSTNLIQTFCSPVLVGTKELSDKRALFNIIDTHQNDRVIPGNSVGPKVSRVSVVAF